VFLVISYSANWLLIRRNKIAKIGGKKQTQRNKTKLRKNAKREIKKDWRKKK